MSLAPAVPGAATATLGGATMGTRWQVLLDAAALPAGGLQPLHRCLEAELERIDAQMSGWRRDSDLSRYNAAPAGSWHRLPEPFLTVLRAALQVAAASAGAFDPTVGALVDLWGFGPHAAARAVPAPEALARATACCGWQRLQLDPDGRLLQPGGLRLDLSAIAKGFAVDRLGDCLDQHGIGSHLVEVGGELRARGRHPAGRDFGIAIEPPAPEAPELALALPLRDAAIATSGDWLRHFSHAGRRYGHTLDPRLGAPTGHGLAQVSVVADRCMQADALATALAVLGPEYGLRHAIAQQLAARFVVRGESGWQVQTSPAFDRLLA